MSIKVLNSFPKITINFTPKLQFKTIKYSTIKNPRPHAEIPDAIGYYAIFDGDIILPSLSRCWHWSNRPVHKKYSGKNLAHFNISGQMLTKKKGEG